MRMLVFGSAICDVVGGRTWSLVLSYVLFPVKHVWIILSYVQFPVKGVWTIVHFDSFKNIFLFLFASILLFKLLDSLIW